MATLWQDVRYAARVMWKRPGFTLLAALALALGIGASSAIFSVVNAVLLRPLPYEESERMVVVVPTTQRSPSMFVSYPDLLDWRERGRVFEALTGVRSPSFNLAGGEEPERVEGLQVSADYFAVYRVRPALGRGFTAEEDRAGVEPVAVISHRLWERRLGSDPSAVGRALNLDGRPHTVVGVLPEDFQGAGRADVLVPIGQSASLPGWMNRDVRPGTRAVARLAPGVTAEAAQAEMSRLAAELAAEHPQTNAGVGVRVTPLHESVVGDTRTPLLVLLGAVLCVLLIACANVASLLLARSAARRREFAVRAALGASRWRIARQLLTESVLLSLLGGSAGLLLAAWGVELLSKMGAATVPRLEEVSVDARVLAFSLAASVLTGLVFGLAPAARAVRTDLNETLKGGEKGQSAGAGRRLSGALVVAETALALVLLAGAGLLVRSFVRLQAVETGFDPSGVLTMRVPLPRARYDGARTVQFYRQLTERLAQLPGVGAAAVANELPLTGRGWPVNVERTDRPAPAPGEETIADWAIVSPDYFRTMGINLLRGRAFTDADAQDSPQVAIVDEEAARLLWPEGDAVGRQLRVVGPRPFEVVGVASRVRSYGLDLDSRMRVYVPAAQTPTQMMYVAVRAAGTEPEALAGAAAAEVRALDPDQPVYLVRTMDEVLSQSVAPRRFNTLLLGVFALVALTLASIGTYGVISHSVAQRTHEIGVRMALGAQRRDVLRLVVGQGMWPALAGTAVGLAAALALTRLMSGMLYGVPAHDPATFLGVAALLVAVALAACYLPARRAARVDPMEALRYE